MKLIELKPEEAKDRSIFLSPDGKILGGEPNCHIMDIAEEIMKEKYPEANSAPLLFLSKLGWLYRYEDFLGWDWYGFMVNEQQLPIAKEIDDNDTIKFLVKYHLSK